MLHKEFKIKFHLFLLQNAPLKVFEELLNKVIKSGAIDIEKEQTHSYRLVKIVYYAILCEMAEQWKPAFDKDLIEAENLRRFL